MSHGPFGKLYVPPGINQIPPSQRPGGPTGSHPGLGERDDAPNSRESNWRLVSSLRTPFGAVGESNSFGFWFNYFWDEAVTVSNLTQPQKVRLAETFFSVFSQSAVGRFTVRQDFAGRDNAFKENVLRQLLLIGFERVAIDPPERFFLADALPSDGAFGRPPAPMPKVAVDAAALNLAEIVAGAGGKNWIIAFRCDSRSYDQLKKDGGFNTRARSGDEDLRKRFALDQPWHPYANPVYSNSLFLRRGKNKDNCLHTVISVGSNFHAATHFPILADLNNFATKSPSDQQYLAGKPFEEWTKTDEQVAAAHRFKLKAIKDGAGRILYLEKENHVHVMYLNDLKGVNTQEAFSDRPFPERGMANVPAEKLLADLLFLQRYWYNPNLGQLSLFDLEFMPLRWVPDEPAVTEVIGAGAKASILRIIETQTAMAKTASMLLDEKGDRRACLINPPKILTPKQRIQVLKLLHVYTASTRADQQRNYIIGQLPSLRDKIEAFSQRDWESLYHEAKNGA